MRGRGRAARPRARRSEIQLPAGLHDIHLEVTTPDGITASDDVVIEVAPGLTAPELGQLARRALDVRYEFAAALGDAAGPRLETPAHEQHAVAAVERDHFGRILGRDAAGGNRQRGQHRLPGVAQVGRESPAGLARGGEAAAEAHEDHRVRAEETQDAGRRAPRERCAARRRRRDARARQRSRASGTAPRTPGARSASARPSRRARRAAPRTRGSSPGRRARRSGSERRARAARSRAPRARSRSRQRGTRSSNGQKDCAASP